MDKKEIEIETQKRMKKFICHTILFSTLPCQVETPDSTQNFY